MAQGSKLAKCRSYIDYHERGGLEEGQEGEGVPELEVLQDQGGLRVPQGVQLRDHQGVGQRGLRSRLQGCSFLIQAHHCTDPEKKFAIKINFNTVSR